MKLKPNIGDIVVVLGNDGDILCADLVLDKSDEDEYYETHTLGRGPNRVSWDNVTWVRIV